MIRTHTFWAIIVCVRLSWLLVYRGGKALDGLVVGKQRVMSSLLFLSHISAIL